jgi:outer membrane protein TolC
MIAPLLFAAMLAAQDTSHLTLAEAVRHALAQHPSVGAARAEQDAAAAGVGQARAARFPQLAGSFGWTRSGYPNIVYPLHGLANLATNPPLFDRNVTQGTLNLGYTLYDFGARGSRVRLAESQARRAGAALDATEAALVAQVADAYLNVLTTRGVLQAQEQDVAALRAEADRVARMEAEGKAARVDVLRVAAEVSRARANQVATAAQLSVEERALAQLTGLPVDSTCAANLVALRLADSTVASREALVAQAATASPEVEQARRAADAARASAGVARAAYFPQLRLSAAYLEFGRGLSAFKPEWNASLQISYPIFTGFGRASAVRQSDAEARAAAERVRSAEQSAEQAVDAALASVSAARATVEALETAVAQFAEVERIRQLSLQVGSGTETDYLEAEATLLSTRASLVQAQHAEMAARVELARVTGELSPEWLARTLVQ